MAAKIALKLHKASKDGPILVSIERPPADIIIVIRGTTHKICESEAKELYSKLHRALDPTGSVARSKEAAQRMVDGQPPYRQAEYEG